MKRCAGFDLNGWHDRVARNWRVEEGEIKVEAVRHVIEGSFGSALVRPLDDPTGRGVIEWIGGPQAALAPHGRGPGWGGVGSVTLRQATRKAQDPDAASQCVAAAAKALAPRPDVAVLAIPDIGDDDPFHREAILKGLSAAGARRRMLVWRPILLALSLIEDAAFPEGNPEVVTIVTHEAQGFAVQRLRLRDDAQGSTPERRHKAVLVPGTLGYESLLRHEIAQLSAGLPSSPKLDLVLAADDLPERLALGFETEDRLMRLWNGDWAEVSGSVSPLPQGQTGLRNALDHTEKLGGPLYVETLLTGERKSELGERISSETGCKVVLAEAGAVVNGAALAAERLAAGRIVYYDFLPQMSTICLTREGPETVDLVPEDARLPAGREWRSPVEARFGLKGGQNRIVVWLRRDGDPRPRRTETIVAPSARSIEISLHLEQAPAAGRARLTLQSKNWAEPVRIDWDDAEVDSREWGEILVDIDESLERPGVPDPAMVESSLELWQDLLEQLDGTPLDEETLALWIGKPDGKKRLLSNQGQPHAWVGRRVVAHVDECLEKAADRLCKAVEHRHAIDRDTLYTLTWSFAACPRRVVPHLLDCEWAHRRGKWHPLIESNRTLRVQGLGRVAATPDEVRRIVEIWLESGATSWNMHERAALAFALGRTAEGPLSLTPDQTDAMAEAVQIDFERVLRERDFGQRFRYTPGLLLGLLRWRQRDPTFLFAPIDKRGARLLELVKTVADTPAAYNWHNALRDVEPYLAGGATRPDILTVFLD